MSRRLTPSAPWFSFEARMLRRRLGRCLLRADLAIEDRNLEEARSAIAEAREIGGNSPELAELEERLQEIQWPVAVSARFSGLRALLAASGGLLLASVLLVGGRLWLPQATAGAGAAPAGTGNRGLSEQPSAPTPEVGESFRLRVVSETVSARAVMPRVLLQDPEGRSLPPPPPSPIALSLETTAAPEAVSPETRPPAMRAEPLATPTGVTVDSIVAQPTGEPRVVQRVPDPPPLPPARSTPPDAVPAVSASGAGPAPATAPVRSARNETVPNTDDSDGIRATLQQYALAYSRLDAAAASAVWPAVDRGKLERAFDGLASQKVTLGECDVRIDGPAARATCAGSATWEPKVGGRSRTEPRQWSFELRKAEDGWQIERALARGGI